MAAGQTHGGARGVVRSTLKSMVLKDMVLRGMVLMAAVATSWGLAPVDGPIGGRAAQAADDIQVGRVVQFYIGAYGQRMHNSVRKPLYLHDPVYSDQTIETTRLGVVKLRFLDETELHVAENSSITLDRYIYDPATDSGEMAVSFTKGVFRFISGKIRRDSYTIRTPSAAIGIRGTNLGIAVNAIGQTIVDVFSGRIGVTPSITNVTTEVDQFNTVTVDPDGSVSVQGFPPGKMPLVPNATNLDFIEVPDQEPGQADRGDMEREASSYSYP